LELKTDTLTGTVYDLMKENIEQLLQDPVDTLPKAGRSLKIPVLYDGMDILSVAKETGLDAEEVIHIHSTGIYKVYMLGFLPGFAYMGQLDARLYTRRKPQPRMIKSGSVAIAGWQTGIYPVNSPGGWSVIGRTPVQLLSSAADVPTLFQAGDFVNFYPVTGSEFNIIASNENYSS
jgi:inhibitor of KinA